MQYRYESLPVVLVLVEEVGVSVFPLHGARDAVRQVPVGQWPRVHGAYGRLPRRVKLPVGRSLKDEIVMKIPIKLTI